MQETIILNSEEKKSLKKGIVKKIILLLFLGGLLFYFYIRFGEPNFLTVHEYAITDNLLPYSFHGTKIVHFSDILYGSTINEKGLNRIVNQINALKPDVLIYTGDLFNANIHLDEKSKQNIKEILSKTQATYKKYAVIGDNDYVDKNSYIEIMENAGFKILNNKNDFLYFGGNEPLVFIGTNSMLEKENGIELAMQNTEDFSNMYKIWLNHEPIIMKELLKKDINPNLIFSGHTLNGLLPLPFQNYLLKQEGIEDYKNSFYQENNTKMYISNGLGTYNFKVRFLNAPSINLYRLYQY